MTGTGATDRFVEWLDMSGGGYDVWAVVEYAARRVSYPEGSAHHMGDDALREVCNVLAIMSHVPREVVRDFVRDFSECWYDGGTRVCDDEYAGDVSRVPGEERCRVRG